jgi:hypothetical protein
MSPTQVPAENPSGYRGTRDRGAGERIIAVCKPIVSMRNASGFCAVCRRTINKVIDVYPVHETRGRLPSR